MSVIQKCILRGQIANLVETRNMFTARLNITGGDTADLLWDTYLGTIIQPLQTYLQNTVTFNSREILEQSGIKWLTLFDDPVSYAGTDIQMAQLPNSSAFVFIAKTLANRVVGRKFWSGLGQQWADANIVGGLAVAALATSFAAYIAPWTSLSGSTFQPGVVDKNGTFQQFVGGFVSAFLGSQRRRKPGIGI